MLRFCHCANVYIVMFLGYVYFSLYCVSFVHCWFLYWFSDSSVISVFLWSIIVQSADMFWCWKLLGSFFVTTHAFCVLMYKRIYSHVIIFLLLVEQNSIWAFSCICMMAWSLHYFLSLLVHMSWGWGQHAGHKLLKIILSLNISLIVSLHFLCEQ